MSARVYLDHNATSPLRPEARRAMEPYFGEAFGNAESLHFHGQQAKAGLERARRTCAGVLGCDPREVVFTSGGTESLNLALRGIAWARRLTGKGMRIVLSGLEHAAVRETARSLEDQGFDLVVVQPLADGRIDPARFASALDDWTAAAALMYANNETGVIQPVSEALEACRHLRIPLVVDAVQAPGRLPLNFGPHGPAALALSAHKFEGPKGAGLLRLKAGTLYQSHASGGGHEGGARAGTHNLAGIAGLAEALRLAEAEREAETARQGALRAEFEAQLKAAVPGLAIHGEAAPRLCNTVYVSIPGQASETLVNALDLEGISVSSGAACSEGTHTESFVLRAMAADDAQVRSAVRFSMGRSTSADDLRRAVECLKQKVS
ncbi:MAG: cysteine desulfurase [Planctomycetota bacterium]|nr:cysteine desulfurase [Planctomycetota bacterium]